MFSIKISCAVEFPKLGNTVEPRDAAGEITGLPHHADRTILHRRQEEKDGQCTSRIIFPCPMDSMTLAKGPRLIVPDKSIAVLP